MDLFVAGYLSKNYKNKRIDSQFYDFIRKAIWLKLVCIKAYNSRKEQGTLW